jgi:penicillin-binding protein 2
MIRRQQFTVKRLLLIGLSFSICLGIIMLRLAYLQLGKSDELFEASIKNFTRFKHVPYPRGNIVDRFGHLLATNRPLINIYWIGTGNKKLSEKQEETIRLIEEITEKKLSEELSSIQKTERFSREYLIVKDINFNQLTKLSEAISDNKNIKLEHLFERYYPKKNLASHIVGYLGKYDLEAIGKYGLEKQFHDELKGTDGIEQKTINSVGKAIKAQQVKDGSAGTTVVTTIDMHLQELAEAAFPEEYNGCMILMNPQSGAIRTLLSRPNFDPSIFLTQISAETWKELQAKRPFINRALSALYPPASLFKMVSASAALENNIINQHSLFCCCGSTTFCGRKYRCSNKDGHGQLDVKDSLAKSCNIMFFEIGKKISIDTIASFAHKLGLGATTGILLDEKNGIVPSSQWKLRNKGERWWPGETLSATIGQSYTLVTPMQMARMYSGIYTGYLIKPRLLESESIEKEQIDIKPETRKFLKQSMKAVVQSGTGQRISRIKDIKAYFKTGTAQVSSIEQREADNKYLEHGWLVGTFKYKNYEPLTLALLVENCGSSRVATEIAQKFLRDYKNMIDSFEEMQIIDEEIDD